MAKYEVFAAVSPCAWGTYWRSARYGAILLGEALRHKLWQISKGDSKRMARPATPTLKQISTGLARYKRGDRPWPTGWSEWHVKFEDGSTVPVKYLYGLAMDVRPSTYSTDTIKAAIRPLGLNIVNTADRATVIEVDGSVDSVEAGLADAVQEAERTGAFDAKNVEDAKRRVLAGIVRRQGQPAFRKALIEAYGGACVITGCTFTAILEAAHVHPYMGDHTNVASNGLLLRTDIHTLFDLCLIAIDPESLTVLVSPQLDPTEYAHLRGRKLRRAVMPTQCISMDALVWHRSRCGW